MICLQCDPERKVMIVRLSSPICVDERADSVLHKASKLPKRLVEIGRVHDACRETSCVGARKVQ